MADSEGCPSVSATTTFSCALVVAYSANYSLLEYVRGLLENYFDINSNLRLARKRGLSDSVIGGRVITRTNNLYSLEVYKINQVQIFSEKVGFSINRKNQKLIDALTIMQNHCSVDALKEWKKRYIKVGKMWVRRNNPNSSIDKVSAPTGNRTRVSASTGLHPNL